MRLLPAPADLLRFPAAAVEALSDAVSLVPRLVSLVDAAESLVNRVGALLDSVESVRDRAESMVSEAEHTRERADTLLAHTEPVVVKAAGLINRALPPLDRLLPLLERALPSLDRLQAISAQLADTTSDTEVNAITLLIDTTPELVSKLRKDILPILDTLGTVAPDLRDVLDVTREVKELLGSLPGLGKVMRRIDERDDDPSEYRADEIPPSAPLRG